MVPKSSDNHQNCIGWMLQFGIPVDVVEDNAKGHRVVVAMDGIPSASHQGQAAPTPRSSGSNVINICNNNDSTPYQNERIRRRRQPQKMQRRLPRTHGRNANSLTERVNKATKVGSCKTNSMSPENVPHLSLLPSSDYRWNSNSERIVGGDRPLVLPLRST